MCDESVSALRHVHCLPAGKTNCCTSLKVLGVHTDGGMRERMVLPAAHLYPSKTLNYGEAGVD